MKAVFSMKDVEHELATVAQQRVGAEGIDGCLYKTSVQTLTNDQPGGDGATEQVVVIEVALPEDVADRVVQQPTDKQKVEKTTTKRARSRRRSGAK